MLDFAAAVWRKVTTGKSQLLTNYGHMYIIGLLGFAWSLFYASLSHPSSLLPSLRGSSSSPERADTSPDLPHILSAFWESA